MDTYLPNILNSLRTNSRSSVSSVLRNVKAEKSEMSALIAGINGFQVGTSYDPGLVDSFSILNREFIMDAFRDADIRIKNYFGVANTVGLIVNSMIDIFSSEIEKVEKDIEVLEDFVNNYEYIAGKDDLFNSNYIEKFDNFLSDYRSDGITFSLPDRDGINFDENGNGFVDTKSGLFKIGSSVSVSNVTNKIDSIQIKSNYALLDHSDTGFNGALTETIQDSWSVSVKSPSIIKSSLSEVAQYCTYNISSLSGAQTYVEINFVSPQVIDTCYITPNYSNGLQLLQLVLFEQNENSDSTFVDININTQLRENGFNASSRGIIPVLSSPKLLESVTEIPFEKKNVNKIIMIFNQPLYKRTETLTNNSEIVSRKLYEIVKNNRLQRTLNTDILQDLVYNMFLRNNTAKELFKNKSYISNYYSYRYPISQSVKSGSIYGNALSNDLKENEVLKDSPSSIISNMFQNFVAHVIDKHGEIFDQSTFIDSSNPTGSIFNFRSVGLLPLKKSNTSDMPKVQGSNPQSLSRSTGAVLTDLLAQEKSDQYEYMFSVRSIDFGLVEKNRSSKACFVSKKIPTNGHPLAIKAKILGNKSNFDINNYNFDIGEASSYELSISNIEIPDSESDWIPIVPTGQSTISSEVLFFDNQNFNAKTRFSFSPNSVTVYKDGFALDPSQYTVYNTDITLKSFSPNSTYCARYDINTSLYSYDVVDYVANGLLQESSKPAYGSDGEGELFSSTDMSNQVIIQNIPYVNSEYTKSSIYSPSIGTIFTGTNSSYSPVKVLLSDGSYAINLTNYSSSSDSPSFPENSGVYFIQNGKNIVFNRMISSPFRVLYSYLPNTLRFRLILRNNIPNLDYSASADAVLIKCKTKVYDPYYDKLTKVIVKN